MRNRNRIVAMILCLVLVLMLGVLGACKGGVVAPTPTPTATAPLPTQGQGTEKSAKYIFLFIGDGMGANQVQATSFYQNALATQKPGAGKLSFLEFPVIGLMNTYDQESYIPDSAASGTAMATGKVTVSSRLGTDSTGTVKYDTIAEQLKAQKGFKIGIVSSVYLNHATPAAFYANSNSRTSYYAIGEQLIQSGFEYFGGGGINDAASGPKDLFVMAQEAGYTVTKGATEGATVNAGTGKAIVLAPILSKDLITVPYRMDAKAGDWSLADYVKKGLEVIDNEQGFFMMVESGRIDWACHANDSNAMVSEVLALDDSVKVALEFYNAHPDETLIVVTGDHETGGLSLGSALTQYKLIPELLGTQTLSFTSFNNNYIPTYKAQKTAFATVLKDIQTVFGLTAPGASGAKHPKLMLTAADVSRLEKAYNLTIANKMASGDEQTLLYGPYEPLTVTCNHLLNERIGVDFTSYVHTGAPLPVYAIGVGAQLFSGSMHNTKIYANLAQLTGVQPTP